MWFVYFVLVMATVLSLSLFGWATYLEESGKQTVQPIAKSVPLPQPRPRQQIAEIAERGRDGSQDRRPSSQSETQATARPVGGLINFRCAVHPCKTSIVT
jgi:hypothetical protein